MRSLEQMRANIGSGREVVVDARSEGRWAGREPEPRPGLPSGHIPGSRSVPFFSLLTPSKTCALPRPRSPHLPALSLRSFCIFARSSLPSPPAFFRTRGPSLGSRRLESGRCVGDY